LQREYGCLAIACEHLARTHGEICCIAPEIFVSPIFLSYVLQEYSMKVIVPTPAALSLPFGVGDRPSRSMRRLKRLTRGAFRSGPGVCLSSSIDVMLLTDEPGQKEVLDGDVTAGIE
jgi:hypothetical protein